MVYRTLTSHSPQFLYPFPSKLKSVPCALTTDRLGTDISKTPGVMSADVLSAIMGVDPVPRVPEAIWLEGLSRSRIEKASHDNEAARALRANLVTHFGENHPLDVTRLLRFQAFKSRRAPKEDN